MAAEGHTDHDNDERVGPLSSPLGRRTRPTTEASRESWSSSASCRRGDVGHLVGQGPAGADRAVGAAGSVAAHRDPRLQQARRGQARRGSSAPRRGGRDDADGAQPRDPPGRAVDDGPGPRRGDPRAAARPLRRRGGGRAVPDALRETFVRKCTVQGRHVKQSGGHGQYAVCEIEIEPLERGGGVEFVDKVVGGAVPRQFIPSVEKGARAQLEKGVLPGYPVVDVRITLFDGKAHSVDSSDMAFQTAAAIALKEAANEATVSLLEPVDKVDITVADEYVGAVMSDLRGRRGAGARDRDRPRCPGAPWCTPRCRRSSSPGTDRPALGVARHRTVHPVPAPLRLHARGAGQAAGQRLGRGDVGVWWP